MDILIKNINAVDKNYNRLVEFLDAANFEWSVQPVLQVASVSGSAAEAEQECSHPSWAVKYIGGAVMCDKCGKVWG